MSRELEDFILRFNFGAELLCRHPLANARLSPELSSGYAAKLAHERDRRRLRSVEEGLVNMRQDLLAEVRGAATTLDDVASYGQLKELYDDPMIPVQPPKPLRCRYCAGQKWERDETRCASCGAPR